MLCPPVKVISPSNSNSVFANIVQRLDTIFLCKVLLSVVSFCLTADTRVLGDLWKAFFP